MRKVPLGDVCQVVSGSTPKRNKPEFWGGTIPWVTPKEISDLSTPYLEDSLEKITDLGYRSCSTTMLPPNSVLLSSRAPIGLLAINKIRVCTNQGFKSLIPSGEVYYGYLYYCLKHNVKALQSKGNGATFKELSKTAVEEFEIPLPPLDDQKRIAYLLGKVERLIAQRKQHLQQLNDLLKSVFLEMFGDPAKNKKGWDINYLGNLTSEKIGYGIVQPGNPVESGVPVIRVGDFVGTKIDTKNITKVSEAISRRHKSSILKGDEILLACVGATIGKVAVVEGIHVGYNIVRATARIRPSQNINRLFLGHFLLSDYAQNYYLKVTHSVGQPTLNIKQIEELPVITPPIHIQNQFANIVEKTEGIKARYQQNLTDLENLYGVLSQKAFKGELDLSRVLLTLEGTEAAAEETPETNEPLQTVDTFDLPAPSDLVTLNSAQSRNALLDQWLSIWLERLHDTPFSTQPFMEAAQQRLSELAEGEAQELGVEAYDQVKARVFAAIECGQIEQTRNKVLMDDKQEFGNRVTLIKAIQD